MNDDAGLVKFAQIPLILKVFMIGVIHKGQNIGARGFGKLKI